MFYQHILLKKKGQFGIIWLAAHCPSKLTKNDVMSLNLVLKCEEITEFITNSNYKKPRFSLQLSAHLMYGLVVLLNRQLNYLYNDLIMFQTELKPVIFKQVLKTPRKARKVDKSALAIKENLPEDSLALDLSFQMPMEIPLDYSIPSERYRDITLTDIDADKLTLLYPIPIDKTFGDVELPPLPNEFIPSSLFGRPELEKGSVVTSTVRKPTERMPLGEIDLNRMKDRKKRPISGTEDTFAAIERAVAETTEIIEPNLETGVEPTNLGETIFHPDRELFEITGIVEQPATIIEAPEVVMPPPTEIPPLIEQVPLEVEKPIERPVKVALTLNRPSKKLKVVSKRKVLIDEIKEISDKELVKRSKHVSSIQPSDIERVTVIKKLPFIDLFNINNKDIRKPMFLSQKINRKFSIYTKYIENNYEISYNVDKPFFEIPTQGNTTKRDLGLQPDESERLRESSVSRRRAGLSIIMPPSEQISTIEREPTSPRKTIEAPSETRFPEMTEIYEPIVHSDMIVLSPPRIPDSLHVQIEPESTRSHQQDILNAISAGKKIFNDIIPVETTKKKRAASMFASLLQLCGTKKVKATQAGAYQPIMLEKIF